MSDETKPPDNVRELFPGMNQQQDQREWTKEETLQKASTHDKFIILGMNDGRLTGIGAYQLDMYQMLGMIEEAKAALLGVLLRGPSGG